MTCPTEETLLQMATGDATEADRKSVLDHIETCSDCRALLDDFQKVSGSLSKAYQLFNEGHETSRMELLNALPSTRLPSDHSLYAGRFAHIISKIGGTPMRRRITFGTVSLLLVAVSAIVFFWNPERVAAWEDVVKAFESKLWIHGELKLTDGTIVSEMWISPKKRVVAGGIKRIKSLFYENHLLDVTYKYDARENKIFRTRVDASKPLGFEMFNSIFMAVFSGDASFEKKGPLSELTLDEKRDVKEGKRKWVDYLFTYRHDHLAGSAGVKGSERQSLILVLRVDPGTNLPHSLSIKTLIEPGKFSVLTMALDYPEKGPKDIYALGVPKTAQLIDSIPSGNVAALLKGLSTGRLKFDNYSAVVVKRSPGEDWPFGSEAYRVWRKGNLWKVEQAARWEMLRTEYDVRENPPEEKVDPATWWQMKADDILFVPKALSDGKDVFQFEIEYKNLKKITDLSFEALKNFRPEWEVKSVRKNPSHFPPDRLGPPFFSAMPELDSHPIIPINEGSKAAIDTASTFGPPNTVLLEVKNELSNRDHMSFRRLRYWIDPKRNHLVMRWEQTQLKNGTEEIGMAYSFRNLKKSPQGYWYPTRVHRENAIRYMDGTTSDYIWDYYLDFKTKIPDNLFDPNHR